MGFPGKLVLYRGAGRDAMTGEHGGGMIKNCATKRNIAELSTEIGK